MSLRYGLLAAYWLAVVIGGIALVVWRLEEYGLFGIAAVGIGAAMLILFSLEHLPSRRTDGLAARKLGDFGTGALIAGAIAILAITLAEGAGSLSLVWKLILLAFLLTFCRIFREFLTRDRTPKRGRRAYRGG